MRALFFVCLQWWQEVITPGEREATMYHDHQRAAREPESWEDTYTSLSDLHLEYAKKEISLLDLHLEYAKKMYHKK